MSRRKDNSRLVATASKDDLEIRLKTVVYDIDGKAILQYRADSRHIAELVSLRGMTLSDIFSPESNGQNIYSLALTPVQNDLLVKIGQYAIDVIINGPKNPMDRISKARNKKDFYEEEFKKRGFVAEAVTIDDTLDDNEITQYQETGERRSTSGRKLTPEEERKIFRRFDWLRYRLMIAGEHLKKYKDKFGVLKEIGDLEAQITETRDQIARHNTALVISLATKTRTNDFDELVSEGNMALFRAINRFEYKRGFKFSTYACSSIIKAFCRSFGNERRYREHNLIEFDPSLEKPDILETKREEEESYHLGLLRNILENGGAGLNESESTVLKQRFYPGEDGKRKTLGELGKMIGISKERVRQIQNKGLKKLREALEGRLQAVRV